VSVHITALAFYPVKSCRAIAADALVLEESGFAHDRMWVLVDPSGRFLSQRECSRLAQVSTSMESGALILSAPRMATLRVTAGHGTGTTVSIWRDFAQGLDQGDAAARWFSDFLDRPVRLAAFDRSTRRLCNPEYAGDSGAHTLFADGYPLLVANEASLASLNAQMPVPLPMSRFRPNLVLSGLQAYDEDHIASLHIGAVSLRLVKPCIRCQITTTDQESGMVGVEPLSTLQRTRFNAALGGVAFGMNAIVTRGAGMPLHRGDTVDVEWNF
jgi:hypothetical protein